MNTRLILILSTLLISVVNASAQGVIIQAPGPPARPSDPEASATRFDLDFPGGTPAQLVAAIEKASSIRVNVVIPTEHAAVQLPSLKMKSVTVQQLFMALEAGSQQSNS